MRAREVQWQRFSTSKSRLDCNAQMAPRHIRTSCELSAACACLLERVMTQHGMTARAHARILKVARTVADLKAAPQSNPNTARSQESGRAANPTSGNQPNQPLCWWVDLITLPPNRP